MWDSLLFWKSHKWLVGLYQNANFKTQFLLCAFLGQLPASSTFLNHMTASKSISYSKPPSIFHVGPLPLSFWVLFPVLSLANKAALLPTEELCKVLILLTQNIFSSVLRIALQRVSQLYVLFTSIHHLWQMMSELALPQVQHYIHSSWLIQCYL